MSNNFLFENKTTDTKTIISLAILLVGMTLFSVNDVQFNLDNKGAKLRNESVINAVEMSLPIPGRGKSYDFTKPFILFMIENGKSNPYFALRVSNTDYLVRDASDSSN